MNDAMTRLMETLSLSAGRGVLYRGEVKRASWIDAKAGMFRGIFAKVCIIRYREKEERR